MAARRCAFCKDRLPDDARSNRKFCDDDCRRGRTKPPTVEDGADSDDEDDLAELGAVERDTERAIAKAREEKRIGTLDAGTVAAIRVLAEKIDTEAARWEYAFEWAQLNAGEAGGPKPPATDNVSIPTYLRYAESLGLTPAGRGRIQGGAPKEAGGGSTLEGLANEVPKPEGQR